MSPADDDDARVRRARAMALFRYALIREAADPALSTRQRGRLVREVAAREHAGPEVLGLAAALKRENPSRTAAQVARVLRASGGWSPSERTLQRHFVRLELSTRPGGSPPPVFGRFEAGRCNEMWTGDALHGPVIGGRKTYLFAFIDDHSRLITGHRFGHAEDTVSASASTAPVTSAAVKPSSPQPTWPARKRRAYAT